MKTEREDSAQLQVARRETQDRQDDNRGLTLRILGLVMVMIVIMLVVMMVVVVVMMIVVVILIVVGRKRR